MQFRFSYDALGRISVRIAEEPSWPGGKPLTAPDPTPAPTEPMHIGAPPPKEPFIFDPGEGGKALWVKVLLNNGSAASVAKLALGIAGTMARPALETAARGVVAVAVSKLANDVADSLRRGGQDNPLELHWHYANELPLSELADAISLQFGSPVTMEFKDVGLSIVGGT